MSAGTWSESNPSTRARTKAADALTPYAILRLLGSLKITVTLFVLGIVIVLVGTLAQDEQTMVEVKREYFNSWVAMVPVDVFIPQTIYPHETKFDFKIPFPGGAIIGLGLLINLLAAKTTRFSIHAKGVKLLTGLVVSIVGGLLVVGVILTGHTSDGLQGKPPISYDQLWSGLKIGLLLLSLVLAGYTAWASHLPRMAKGVLWTLVASLGALSITLLASEEMKLDAPGLRIVWQLLQATVASSVLLAGFLLLFGKRGGNMLIHVGIALLMVGQFVFGDRQIEQKVYLSEGDQSNVTFIPDALEIAFIDTSDSESDKVTVIPDARIRQAARGTGLIDDPALPCLVRIDKWMSNSKLQEVTPDQKIKATIGSGLAMQAVEVRSIGGASSSVNLTAAYVTLLDRETQKPLETLLLSQELNDSAQLFRNSSDKYEKLSLNGRPYEIALRFRKEYKPYEVTLKDVSRKDYANSNTPRDYSSVIQIRNVQTGEEITEKTWMNNPVRFGGETFYQSDYFPVMRADGSFSEGSGLQVVRNEGWVIPYICCMMVMVGMFSHFGGTFVRYAGKVSREESSYKPTKAVARGAELTEQKASEPFTIRKQFIYVTIGLAVAAAGGLYGLKAKNHSVVDADWHTIGKIPVKHDGRIKPAETVAANVLQAIGEPIFGGLPYVKDADGNKRSNVEWFFGVMTDVPWTRDVQAFRIYAKEVREVLGLEDRDKFRYSYNEINKNREAFFAEVDKLREKSRQQIEFNFREQKISEMYQKLTSYELLAAAYEEPDLPEIESESEEMFRNAMIKLDKLDQRYRAVAGMNPPAFLPPAKSAVDEKEDDLAWTAYAPAKFNSILQRVRGQTPNPAIEGLEELLTAVRNQNAKEIDNAARKYSMLIADAPEVAEKQGPIAAESWLNRFNPTMIGIVLYILALVVGFAAFASPRTYALRHTATGILLGVFVIHTITLLARMYISGRAPVVNLYSSAVFIGWACVLFCLVLELVLRTNVANIRGLSVANIVGSLIGLITLCIARSLDKSDTMHVLAAVLDTQFWLSTHVVTVTLGYAVTYLAGFFGAVALVIMLVRGDSGPGLENSSTYRDIYRLAYFSVCFGILFSFVGTVLGGLWADDSWGRFWGWDPKENGALMIVLWNALVLHARWDRMVGVRGFSILALIGNVITSWSWFGTNLLGLGLHNYGFSKSVAIALVVTVVIHGALIGAALLLTSSRSRASSE